MTETKLTSLWDKVSWHLSGLFTALIWQYTSVESFVPPTATQGVNIILTNANDRQILQVITSHPK